MIALVALLVAGISLAWNVVVTIRNWRTSAARIDLEIKSFAEFGPENTGYLSIVAYNHGGSPIAVSGLDIQGAGQNREGWTFNPGPLHLKAGLKRHVALLGDPLPRTIEPNHSATWLLDLEYVLFGLVDESPPIPVILTVQLSDGSKLVRSHSLPDYVVEAARDARERRPDYMERNFEADTD